MDVITSYMTRVFPEGIEQMAAWWSAISKIIQLNVFGSSTGKSNVATSICAVLKHCC